MKALMILAWTAIAMQASAAEVVIEGQAAEQMYYEYQGIESMIGESTVVKVGDGIVCWQTLKPNSTDVESVRCTVDKNKAGL